MNCQPDVRQSSPPTRAAHSQEDSGQALDDHRTLVEEGSAQCWRFARPQVGQRWGVFGATVQAKQRQIHGGGLLLMSLHKTEIHSETSCCSENKALEFHHHISVNVICQTMATRLIVGRVVLRLTASESVLPSSTEVLFVVTNRCDVVYSMARH